MKESRLREVKSLAQCQTSSKWWCQDSEVNLSSPTNFPLGPDELGAVGVWQDSVSAPLDTA